jgi:hypothetical protein
MSSVKVPFVTHTGRERTPEYSYLGILSQNVADRHATPTCLNRIE